MQPTDILKEEHRVIEQVLACLEKMAEQCAAGKDLDVSSAEEALDFFRIFADTCHHGKEEDILFPLMERKGFSRDEGPTGVMRHEHEEGRRLIGALADTLRLAAPDPTAARKAFVQHARDYILLLREHIHKEDHCLFPMADEAFSAAEQAEVLSSFEKVEHDDLGPETHGKYLELAQRLAGRFGVAAVSSGCGRGCGH